MFDTYNGKFVSELDTLAKRPELAARVGHTIAMWAQIEIHLSQLLSVILGSDAGIGATLFNVVKAESGRLAMIRAVAEERLPPELQDEYQALQKKVATVGAYRDKMAHGSWGISDTDLDCLILVDSRDVARHVSDVTANLFKSVAPEGAHKNDIERANKSKLKYKNSTRIYRKAEFDFVEKQIKALLPEIHALALRAVEASR